MQIILEVSTPPSRMEKIYRALLTTRGQLTQPEAARLVYLSPSAFSHLFTKHSGKSFRAVRVEIKLQIAATLLQQTDLSIPEIAHHIGYSERYKLERSFKQHYGITPTEFRRAQLRLGSVSKKVPTQATQGLRKVLREHQLLKASRTTLQGIAARVPTR